MSLGLGLECGLCAGVGVVVGETAVATNDTERRNDDKDNNNQNTIGYFKQQQQQQHQPQQRWVRIEAH